MIIKYVTGGGCWCGGGVERACRAAPTPSGLKERWEMWQLKLRGCVWYMTWDWAVCMCAWRTAAQVAWTLFFTLCLNPKGCSTLSGPVHKWEDITLSNLLCKSLWGKSHNLAVKSGQFKTPFVLNPLQKFSDVWKNVYSTKSKQSTPDALYCQVNSLQK